MSCSPVISLHNVSKFYEIYDRPRDRLWQILFRGRKKFYREYWACADINLEIYPGECLGIIGRNGAGKSTLLQLMAGTLAPSAGSVTVNGRLAALLELGSGFNPDFTGKENVFLNAAILGLSHTEIGARYKDICEFADIGDFMDRPVKTYSSGMALRVAFAVMANVDADILIIDEALAVGDAFFTQKCMRFLRDFMQNHTVIFVSHDTNAVCSLCSRAALMESGRITTLGSPLDVSRKYLEDLYADQQGDLQLAPSPLSHQENAAPALPLKDMRQEIFNSSNLRNDLQIFPFEQDSQSFGSGHATVANVWLANAANEPYAWIVGGEVVYLHITCKAHKNIANPIIGFFVSNAYGQNLFGDNTWLALRNQSFQFAQDDTFEVVFGFQMPILAPGEYYVAVAIAEGTPEKHMQHHWRHEALVFVSHSSSVSSGLMGVPMLSVELKKQDTDEP